MNESQKKSLLYAVIFACIAAVGFGYKSDNPAPKKDIATVNKATCVNAFNSLKAAKFQKKMLDQQVLLSAAAGRGEEAMAVGAQVSELKAIATIFEKLINDPKLDCYQYLKDEPKVTHKVI